MRGVLSGLVVGENEFLADSNGNGQRPAAGDRSGSSTTRSADPCCWDRRRRPGSARRRRRWPNPATRPTIERERADDVRRRRASATSRPSTSCSIARPTPGCSDALPDPEPARGATDEQLLQAVRPRHRRRPISRWTTTTGRTDRAVHRARRARNDQSRHLRHRGAVRSAPALVGAGTAAAVERQGGSTPSAPRPVSRACSSAASRTGPMTRRLSRGFMVVDNSLTDSLYNSEPGPGRRDADDDEGAHRRHLRRDHLHAGQRVLRADPSSRTRPPRSSRACSTASSRAATTRIRSRPASR